MLGTDEFKNIYVDNMPHVARYFHNKLPDYIKGEGINLNVDQTIPALSHALDFILKHASHRKPTVYTGQAGIAYVCWHVSRIKGTAAAISREQLTSSSVSLAREAVNHQHHKEYGWSLLSGEAGCLCVAALALQPALSFDEPGLRVEQEQYIERYKELLPLAIQCKEDEFLYGRAGYLMGCLLLNKHIGSRNNGSSTTTAKKQVVPDSILLQVAHRILESGRSTAMHVPNCPSPLYYYWHDSPYLGAAHGLMGILYVLLHVFTKLSTRDQQDIEKALRFVLSLECDEVGRTSNPSGFYPSSMEGVQPDREPLVHWCHGSTGAVFLFGKAYQVFNNEEYLQGALRSGNVVWERGLLKKGPGACHGVAGNGHALLYLFKVTGDEKWLHRALQFAGFMQMPDFKHHAHTPDHPHSLFEGWGAAACLWADLLDPGHATGFPLFVL